jgi:uncharacterized membrane protein
MKKNILVKSLEIVGVLFAAFGGFFVGIAPPQATDSKFAVGLSSFLALIILLAVAAATKRKYRARWILTSFILFVTSIAAALYYKVNYDALTFEYPPENTEVEHIAGTQLTPAAADYVRDHPGISNSQLLAKFGGLENKGKVWSIESINRARTKLTVSYVSLVLSISGAVFALTEGALAQVTGRTGRTLAQAKPRTPASG